jgi:hypothetical protein
VRREATVVAVRSEIRTAFRVYELPKYTVENRVRRFRYKLDLIGEVAME